MKQRTIKVECIEHLEDIVMDNLKTNESVSVVANYDLIWEMAIDFVREGVELDLIDVNTDYDKEYYLSFYLENDSDINMSIEKAYCETTGKYLSTDGVVFVDVDTNPQYVTDALSNKFVGDSIAILYFTFNEDEDGKEEQHCHDCELKKEVIDTQVVYTFPVCMESLIEEIDDLIDRFVFDF